MKIKVVTGQSTYFACQNLIEEIKADNLDENHFILVPDRFSLQVENLVMELGQREATFNIEVLGLSRLANRVLRELGVKGQALTNDGVLLLTQQAIENVKHNFQSFKKTSINFTQEVSKVISQFKSSLLEPKDIVAKSNSISMQKKYHDLALIYTEYEALIEGRLDANKLLSLFSEQVKQSKILKDTYLYLVGFDSFTSEMFSLIVSLAKSAKGLYIALPKASNVLNSYIYEDDILSKLKKLCQEEGIIIEISEKKAKLLENQECVIDNLYSSLPMSKQNNNFFSSIVCNNLMQEVMTVGKLINSYVRNGGRYKDVAIACANLEKYQPYFERCFAQLQVPYYSDVSITADKLILSQALFKYLKVVASGYSKNSLLDYFSCELMHQDNSKEILQNIIKFNIHGKAKFYKYLSSTAKKDKELFEKIETGKTCEDYCLVAEEFLLFVKERYEEKLAEIEIEYPKEQNINLQAEKYIKLAISSIMRYQSFYEVSVGEFIKKIELLLSFNQVSTVPTYVDSVMIGDATSSYFVPCKRLFVLSGADALPQVVADNGLITDNDIENVKFIRNLEPTIRMLNRRNRFKLFNLLSLAQEKLIVTYRAVNDEGKKLEKPAFLANLCQIFNTKDVRANSLFIGVDEDGDNRFVIGLGSTQNAIEVLAGNQKSSFVNCRQFSALNKALRFDLEKLYLPREEIKGKVDKLFFPKGYTKVTQLETYFSCPFKHFVRYGLKITEPETTSLEQKDIGNICHFMAEIFVKQYMKSLASVEDDEIKLFINNNFDKVLNKLNLIELLEDAEDKESLLGFIKRQIYLILSRICYEQKWSRFKPVYIEKSLEGLSIEIGNSGRNMPMQGKVDRIDVYDGYFRILDYKTGQVNPLLKDLYYGDKLQLFIYQKAVAQSLNMPCGGVFYFDCKFDYYEEENTSLLKGLVINDDQVISNSDTRIGTIETSDILAVSLRKKAGKDGSIYKGSSICQGSLLDLQQYASRVASQALGEITEGYIAPKPDEFACNKCQYKGICLYNISNGIRKKTGCKSSDIENCIKGGENNE